MNFVTDPTRETKDNYDYQACKVSVNNGTELELDSIDAGVKVRGNWTTNYDKKPLRIKFNKKQSMLGLNEGQKFKNWLLLAEYKDWSMIRNASSFYLAHLMSDDYASDFRLVNVYINNQYWGVYLLCEQQEVKDGRIGISEAEELEGGAYYEGTDIGYFLEFDGYYDEEKPLEQFTINYGTLFSADGIPFNNFQKGFTIKSDIYSQAQNDFIKNYMQKTFKICYEAIYNNKYYEFNSSYTEIVESNTLTNSYEAISKVIDVDSIVNSYILAEITCDVDVAWSSFYMDVDFGANGDKLLRFEAPWDFDSCYGNTRGCLDGKGLYAANIITNASSEQAANPWYLLFIKCDWFKQLVKQKWNGMIEQNLFSKVTSYIDTVSTKYETDFVNNYDKWHNCGWKGNGSPYGNEFDFSESGNCTTQKEAATFMKNWLGTRVTNLTEIFNKF